MKFLNFDTCDYYDHFDNYDLFDHFDNLKSNNVRVYPQLCDISHKKTNGKSIANTN